MRKEPAEVAMEASRLKQEEGEGVEEAVPIPLDPDEREARLLEVGVEVTQPRGPCRSVLLVLSSTSR